MPWVDWTWGGAPNPFTADCVFFADSADGTLSDLADDESQRLTDLSVGTDSVYETSSARFLANTERTIDLAFTANEDNGGYLWRYGSQSFRLEGGAVIIEVNGVDTLSLDLGMDATQRDYVVTWTMAPNTGGSGSSSRLSELFAWCQATGYFSRARATHATPTATTTTCVWWAHDSSGTTAFDGTRAAARFCTSYHTATETYEEMIAASSAPTTLGEERVQVVVPPASAGIGDDGYFAGPVHALAAAACRAEDLRLVGPLINEVCRSVPSHRGDFVGDEAVIQEDPAQAGRYLLLPTLHYAPVPPGANRISVSVYVRQWRISGDPDRLEITALSLSQPGFTVRPDTSPAVLAVHRVTATRTHADAITNTAGAWVDLEGLRVARDLRGWTYLALAFRVVDGGGGSGSTDDQLFLIRAITADAYYSPAGAQIPAFGG